MDRLRRIGGPSYPTCSVEGCTKTFYRGGSYDWALRKCVSHRMLDVYATREFKKVVDSLKVKFAFDVLEALT